MHGPDGTFISYSQRCWQPTTRLFNDALEPRGELMMRDAPPSTRTAWRVSYDPAQRLPDGTTRVRWTGYVAAGEAIVGADGLLKLVRIFDHHEATSSTAVDFDFLEIEFTGFPLQLSHRRIGDICRV